MSHAHREGNNSIESADVNVARLCRKTGAVYQSLDNDETQFTKPVETITTENTATTNVQENPPPELNEIKTTT